jgi:hypothetical protein
VIPTTEAFISREKNGRAAAAAAAAAAAGLSYSWHFHTVAETTGVFCYSGAR